MLHFWERIPLLQRIAGIKRFQQYVAKPIPKHIKNIYGGFRGGLYKGYILTYFEFAPPFEQSYFLKGWKQSDTKILGSGINILVKAIYKKDFAATNIYTQVVHPARTSSRWLLIDENNNCGTLYDAVYFGWL